MNKESLKQKPFYLNESQIAWVNTTLEGMTVDEKIGQLFCACVRRGTTEEIDELTSITPIGGLMYRPLKLEETITLTNFVKKSKIPMLIAGDLEYGGNVIADGGTKIGSEMEIAATDDPKMAAKLAKVAAVEGGVVGINWNFAPDVDIDFNYRNPITNIRTFGSDPERVIKMSTAYVKELQRNGLAASVKHYPGDGVDDRDHHLVTNVNTLSKEEWDDSYGKVYKECIDAGTMTVMVGHIMLPAYEKHFNPTISDKDILPASMSKSIMQNLLRDQLGFNGLVVTDATTMSGFSIPMHRKYSVPMSIANGADIFLFSRNMPEDVSFMKKGYDDGIITPERLDEAVTRILALKAALKLNEQQKEYIADEARKVIGTPEHKQIAREVADRAITLVKEEDGVLPVTPERYPRLMYYPLKNDATTALPGEFDVTGEFKTMLEEEGFEVTEFNPSKGAEGRVAPMSDFVEKYDVMVYLANIATRSNQTTVRVEWSPPLGANCPHFVSSIPTIFISVANPYHLVDAPRIRTFINSYYASKETLEEIVRKLTGKSEFKGISPSDPFCGRWDTRLK